jgi:hypothetical protein
MSPVKRLVPVRTISVSPIGKIIALTILCIPGLDSLRSPDPPASRQYIAPPHERNRPARIADPNIYRGFASPRFRAYVASPIHASYGFVKEFENTFCGEPSVYLL